MRPTGVLLGLGAAAGFSVGIMFSAVAVMVNTPTPPTQPPPKFVEVPQIEVRDVPGPTEYVVQPLPKSCEDLIDAAQAASKSAEKVDQINNEMTLYIDDVFMPAALTGNIPGANLGNIKIQKWADQLGSVMYKNLNAQDGMEFDQKQCQADLKAAEEGDDYTPIEGAPSDG